MELLVGYKLNRKMRGSLTIRRAREDPKLLSAEQRANNTVAEIDQAIGNDADLLSLADNVQLVSDVYDPIWKQLPETLE